MNQKPRICIIGAGPCGLGAGWRLHELGYENFVIYEQNAYPGGLSASFIDQKGFTWDIGGHVLHSHYPYFDHVFSSVMKGEYFTHERQAWVWLMNRFVPYPFQNNIHRLPPAIRDECLRALETARQTRSVSLHNFRDWILASFGEGIARYFLLPYNEKVWAYPPQQMDYRWVGERVAMVDVARMKQNIVKNRDDVSWGPNAVFHFPKHGGTGDVWNRIARVIGNHIVYGRTVTSIDTHTKTLQFSDGTADTYDILLSTMPLDVLVNMVRGNTFPHTASDLHHSTVTVVGIGIRGGIPDHLQGKCWIYFPEPIAPFYRATVFSHYSLYNAPKGNWSLMFEVASSEHTPVHPNIIDHVIEGARKTQLISSKDTIMSVWSYEAEYGYPTPTLTRNTVLNRLLPRLEHDNIYSRGRFGSWKYEVGNMDHSFMQGVEWVNNMKIQ